MVVDKNFLEDFFKTTKSIYKVDDTKFEDFKNIVFDVEKNIFLEDFYFVVKSLESNILSVTEKTFSFNDLKDFFVFIKKVFDKIVFFNSMNDKQKFYFLKELELLFLLTKNYDFDFEKFFYNISVLDKDDIVLLLFNFNEFKDVNIPELEFLFLSFDKSFFEKIVEKNAFENFLEYLSIIKDSLNVFLGDFFEENISILNNLFLKYNFDTFKITAIVKDVLEFDSKKAYEYLQLKE